MRERLTLPSTRMTMSSVKPTTRVLSVASMVPPLSGRTAGGSLAATLHLSLRTASSTSSKASCAERSMTKVRRSG